jgi:hypothetical protein
MTAAVFSSARRPRRVGMKVLTAVLTAVCAIELLIAFEQIRPPSEWRVASAASPVWPTLDIPAPDLGAWASGLRDRAVGVLRPTPVRLADATDTPLRGRFVAAEPDATVANVSFEGAVIRLGDETLRTRPWRIALGGDGAVQGWTFARRLAAAPDAQIELRQVLSSEDGAAVAASPLCGGRSPGTVALLHRRDQIDLMLFRVGATPGPDAPVDALCGTWTLRRQ